MKPQPDSGVRDYRPSGKFMERVALITDGASGIDVAVVYLNEHRDAKETKRIVEQQGRKCLLLAGEIGNEKFCKSVLQQTVREWASSTFW